MGPHPVDRLVLASIISLARLCYSAPAKAFGRFCTVAFTERYSQYSSSFFRAEETVGVHLNKLCLRSNGLWHVSNARRSRGTALVAAIKPPTAHAQSIQPRITVVCSGFDHVL